MSEVDIILDWQANLNEIKIIDNLENIESIIAKDHLRINTSRESYNIYCEKIENPTLEIIINHEKVQFHGTKKIKYDAVKIKKSLSINVIIDNNSIVFN